MARSGWRERSAARDALLPPVQLPGREGAVGAESDGERRLISGAPLEKALWFSRVPSRAIVVSKLAVLARRQEIKVNYKNYFTRKNAMGKSRKASGIMNSGYRP